MNKIRKFVASTVIACSVLSFSYQPFAFADWTSTVYEEKNVEYIAKGVKHEHILKFTDQGWLNINVLRVDLTEQSNSLEVLTHEKGLSTKGKLSQLVSQRPHVVGAINGDFFNMNSNETLGPIVQNGELISTPFYQPDRMATFNIGQNNQPFIDYWTNPQLDFNNKTRPAMLKFSAINKNSGSANTAILYNHAWGEKTPPTASNLADAIEVIVEDGKIREILSASSGSIIPANGYILWASGWFASHVQEHFMAGDEVELEISTLPDFQQLALTLGGGAAIVKNGAVPSVFTHEIKGNQPRTALGISRDKTEVFLLTIDGRTSSYTGVSQKELGEIMVSLGAYEAINLDGGGSTEMILRPYGESNQKIINNLSDGSERNLMNGLGVINNAPKTSNIGGIKLEASHKNIFVNSSVVLTLKAQDSNFNPTEVDATQVKWYVTGVKGSFAGNSFIPSTSGKALVAAEYKGAYATAEIHVLDKPAALLVSPGQLNMDSGAKRRIEVLGLDQEGYSAPIPWKDLKVEIPSGLGAIDSNGSFTASAGSSTGSINISFGNITASLPVSIGSQQSIVDSFEASNGSFIGYPAEVTGGYELAPISKSGQYSGKLSYDFTATDATRAAYMVFTNGGLTFPQKISKLGMWVYGDEGGGHWLRAKLVDSEGAAHTLDLSPNVNWTGWKYLEVPVPAAIKAPVKLERIYVVQTDPLIKNQGAVYIDDLTAFYASSATDHDTASTLKDSRAVKAELKGNKAFRFMAHGMVSGIDTLMDNLAINKMAELSNTNAALSVFTGTVDAKLQEKLNNTLVFSNGSYGASPYEDSLFINLDNSKGSLRETNFAQWSWFLKTIENTYAKNIFILLPNKLSFSDKLEEKLFHDTLQKLKTEKHMDVWVLYGGSNSFNVSLSNGIRYVSLKSYPQNNELDIFTQLNYMMFTVNEDKVTYEILPLYSK